MKRRILIITTEIPYPLTKGGRHGVFHFIDNLRNDYQISVLFKLKESEKDSFDELKSKWSDVIFYTFNVTTPGTPQKSFISTLYNNMYQFPFKIKDMLSKKGKGTPDNRETDFMKENSSLYGMSDIINDNSFIDYISEISRNGFDIIQVEFYPLLSLIHVLPPDIEKVFIHHELRYIRNELEMHYFQNKSTFDQYLFDISKYYELTTLRLYDKIVTVTEIDKQKLQKELPDASIFASPSMVDMHESPEQAEYNYQFNNKLTFIGSCTHFPNVDGIKWFISEIWNHLTTKYPGLELHIVGEGWNAGTLGCTQLSNVIFDGYVKDLSDILPNSISIVPIKTGSGMRMKILDAVNYRIPFVTTSIGIEGLDFRNEEDCYISDSSETFVDSIIKIIEDKDIQYRFIKKSHKTLNEMYDRKELLLKRKLVYETPVKK